VSTFTTSLVRTFSALRPGAVLLLGCAALVACAVTAPGANDANLAQAKSRATHGASVFADACARCHGPRGEGLAVAPSIIGANALPRYPRDNTGAQQYQDPTLMQRQAQLRVPGAASRQEFVSALDLHDYLTKHLAMVRSSDAEVLAAEDYWAVVNFMLIAHGSAVPAEISAENAKSVPIRSE
jgi:cytochrome c553